MKAVGKNTIIEAKNKVGFTVMRRVFTIHIKYFTAIKTKTKAETNLQQATEAEDCLKKGLAEGKPLVQRALTAATKKRKAAGLKLQITKDELNDLEVDFALKFPHAPVADAA